MKCAQEIVRSRTGPHITNLPFTAMINISEDIIMSTVSCLGLIIYCERRIRHGYEQSKSGKWEG